MAFSFTILRAGAFMLDGGAMFGIVPKPLWSRLVTPDEKNRIPLNTNCLLLEGHGRRVLIETGIGDKFGSKERAIYAMEERCVLDALHEADCDPKDITDVVVTHLHFDHAGGLTRLSNPGDVESQPVPSFPNAAIHTQKTEWDDALANKSTMHKTYLRSHLDPVAAQISAHDGESTLIEGTSLRVFPVPGHTWGQQCVLFEDTDGRTVAFPGDLLPTLNHAGLTYNMAYDVIPHENMQTKQGFLHRAERENWLITLDHEPGEPLAMATPSPERPGQHRLTAYPAS